MDKREPLCTAGGNVNRYSHYCWTTVWRFLKKLQIKLLYDSAFHFWVFSQKKKNNTLNQEDTCTPIFTAALMTIPNTWKQPKCPMWYEYLYTMEYYSAIKKEILPSATTQMDLDGIVSIQLCLTLCNPIDYSLPGFSIHGIFQARILEQVAISFSRGSSQPRD